MIPIPPDVMDVWPEDPTPKKDRKRIRWTIDLDADQHHALSLLAIRAGKTRARLTRDAWQRLIEEHNGTRLTAEQEYRRGLADGLTQGRRTGDVR